MSATAIAEHPVAQERKPRGRRGLLIVLLLVVLGAAGAAWWLFIGPAEPDLDVDGEIVTIEPMTTTVGEDNLHHARVALGVVLVDGQDPLVVEPRIALLKDALLRELSRMNAQEVRSAEGSDELRDALTAEAQDIWGEEVVRRVVLTELLIN